MGVRAEPAAGRDAIVIEDAKSAELVVLRIDIVAEGKRVAAIEPVEVRAAAVGSFANGEHDRIPETSPETVGDTRGYRGEKCGLRGVEAAGVEVHPAALQFAFDP